MILTRQLFSALLSENLRKLFGFWKLRQLERDILGVETIRSIFGVSNQSSVLNSSYPFYFFMYLH
jgi:hypothetical protein